jgi:hypothetical protein
MLPHNKLAGIFQEKHRTILIDWRLVLKVVLLIRKMR